MQPISFFKHDEEAELTAAASVLLQMKHGKTVEKTDAVFRTCTWCSTIHTPVWRKGPEGNDLCNACGIQYNLRKRPFKRRSLELKR